MFEKGFVSMAYGDVGGPNLDFSNMGCFGFCPQEFTFLDWLNVFTFLFTIVYISYWIIKVAIRLIKYTIKTYKSKNQNKSKNENISEGFSVTEKEFEEHQKEENKSFNLKKELAALCCCSIVAWVILVLLAAAFW
tara:strand:- start:60 stop:464 length:405 start_codon:yes stop_codon:yes gene_type:complete